MKIFFIIGLFLISSSFLSAFAQCEKEKDERDHFRDLCFYFEKSSTFGATGLGAGGAFLFGTPIGMGIGFGVGLTTGVVAKNQCRIYEEKRVNLAKCEQDYLNSLKNQITDEEMKLKFKESRQSLYNAFHFHTSQLEKQLEKTLDEHFEAFLTVDGNEPDDEAFIEKTKLIEKSFSDRLEFLKTELKKDVKDLGEELGVK